MTLEEDYKKGRESFEEHFKNQLQKNQSLNVDIEWDLKNSGNQKLAVIVNDKRITLVLENGELDALGANLPKSRETEILNGRNDLLNRKEKELMEKLQQD